MARIIRWIKAILPSDILDDGPQLVVSVGVGALFGAWVTAKSAGKPIDWVWGWPLLFNVLVVAGVVLWIARGKFTDRVKKVKADRESARDTKIDEMHARIMGPYDPSAFYSATTGSQMISIAGIGLEPSKPDEGGDDEIEDETGA
jgi:hypothetical protein